MTSSSSEPHLSFAAVRPGEALRTLQKPTDPVSVVLFCAAIRNFHRLHYDDAFAKAQGLSGTIVPGFLVGNWCLEAVTKSFGPGVRVQRLSFRNGAPALVGDVFTVRGEVTGVSGQDNVSRCVVCEVSVLDPSGQAVTEGRIEIVQRARKSG